MTATPSHRALVLSSRDEPLKVLPTPTPFPCPPGSALVTVLSAPIISYMRDVYTGVRQYPFPTPLITGTSAIARIHSVGGDATRLRPGQLVFVDCFIRARDGNDAVIAGLFEGFSEATHTLFRNEWSEAGTFAEIAKVPLENVYPLDEQRLFGKLSLTVDDLAYIASMVVPFGGLRDINLKPGETIIIAPATGGYGGAGVLAALGLGAGKVIAMGRSEEGLKKLQDVVAKIGKDYQARLATVRITGDVLVDKEALQNAAGEKEIDTFMDLSPSMAKDSTHVKSGILALRRGGRVSLMGGISDDIKIPYGAVMRNSLMLKGKWMYEKEDVKLLIQMAEMGVLKLGKKGGIELVGKFSLDEWDNALLFAEKNAGVGQSVVFVPN